MAVAIPIAMMAVAAAASYQQSRTQAKNLETQANAAEANAAQVRTVEQSESAAGVVKENQMREHQRQILGSQRAGMLQAGLDFHGTSGDVAKDSVMNAELDSLMVQHQTTLNHISRMNQANMLDFQADTYRGNASDVRNNAWLSILGSTASAGAQGYMVSSTMTPKIGAGSAGTGMGTGTVSNYSNINNTPSVRAPLSQGGW